MKLNVENGVCVGTISILLRHDINIFCLLQKLVKNAWHCIAVCIYSNSSTELNHVYIL